MSRPQDQHSPARAAPGDAVHQHIAALNQQAWELSDTDSKRANALAAAAYDLATAPGAPPDQVGIADSLRTQGYLNMRLGDYPLGLTQLTRALTIFDALDASGTTPSGLADVFDGLAGIYAQTGSNPEALEYMHKQLAAAERIGDMRRVANAYNNLVHVYVELGQHERALETLQRNLQLGIAIPYPRIECLSYLNLAEVYLLTGAYALARDNALAGLRRCREESFDVFVTYGYGILGKACRLLGDISQSLQSLDEALAVSRRTSSLVTEAVILLELGQTNRAADRLFLARACFEQALTIAHSIDARTEQAAAHLQLSEVYEQMGDAVQALAHFKQHQAFKDLIAGEKANQRLQVLQVAHDTEMAQREAEHLRSLNDRLEQQVAERTAELTATVALLQKEIGERQRAEAEIQQMVATLEQRVATRTDELATFFDMSLLAGQGSDLADVFEQALPRIMEVSHSRAICIHLLDTGDTAERSVLRLAGQQNVPDEAQASLALVPVSGSFAHWLQQPNDPLLTTNLGEAALLPAAFRLQRCRTYLGAQVKVGGRAEGLLSCYRFRDRGYGIDEIALVTALAEQIGLMLETQRLRRQAEEMAVLAERQRLARDLHDSVTQSLYSLTLFSRAGREAAADGDMQRLQESLASLEHNTLHALREMRLLLYELRPADLAREGLQRAVELRLNTVERRAGLQLDVAIDQLPALPPSWESDLYHIIVEALNNVVKHAAAGHVRLRLQAIGGKLYLAVADDGRGFDPTQNAPGLGLRNMRERAARLHGHLTVNSLSGHGTTVEAILPCPIGED